ncbi:melanoma antigen preferentially expressed in tumors-like [Tenrec ecaudatus]|uniref:melanoma antigen preferentially expressed in tumors-like n=1 Tax=Tenrec ecaudatus TaxID=94439 RepID=UPI003F59E50A
MAAVAKVHSEVVKAMVHYWPFTQLPLGALLEDCVFQELILKAALDGLDILLAQNAQHRRCKLKVLDLQLPTGTNFWNVWAGAPSNDSEIPSEEPEDTSHRTQMEKGPHSRSGWKHQPLTSVEVLTDLWFEEATSDVLLTFLIERVKQKKALPTLCCRKVAFLGPLPQLHILGDILKMVQLDSIQEVEVHDKWDLHSLNWFAPYLAQMGHLQTLFLSGVILDCKECGKVCNVEQLLARFTSQLLNLHQLQHLFLDSVCLPRGCLIRLLTRLPSPLMTLSLTDCVLLDEDLTYLSLCPCTSRLRSLVLCGLSRPSSSYAFLPDLLEIVSTTLMHLNLACCGIQDPELRALQNALGRCSQLVTLMLCGNPVSWDVLQELLQHTPPQCKFLELPVPLHCYVGPQGMLDMDALLPVMEELMVILMPNGVDCVEFCNHRGTNKTSHAIIIQMDS